jgi:hypothetical protein
MLAHVSPRESGPNEACQRPSDRGRAREVTAYLFNTAHRYGASKARFFATFGFRLDVGEALAQALREHGQEHEVRTVRETGFGPRYEVDGELNAPDGRRPRVRTVWQLDHGQIAPRLTTAYPVEGADD